MVGLPLGNRKHLLLFVTWRWWRHGQEQGLVSVSGHTTKYVTAGSHVVRGTLLLYTIPTFRHNQAKTTSNSNQPLGKRKKNVGRCWSTFSRGRGLLSVYPFLFSHKSFFPVISDNLHTSSPRWMRIRRKVLINCSQEARYDWSWFSQSFPLPFVYHRVP